VPIRVVVDNNIPISFILGAGPTIQLLLEHARNERFVWLTSRPIMDELTRWFERQVPTGQLHEDSVRILAWIRGTAEWTDGEPIAAGACRDPDDDKLLSCAVEGQADYVVSGDQHLSTMKEYRGVRIVTPRQLVELLDAPSDEPTA
jgi:putative PIN family toxin of toxin-antitoxin system